MVIRSGRLALALMERQNEIEDERDLQPMAVD